MYHGKRDGRGTFRFFQAGMDLAEKVRAQLEGAQAGSEESHSGRRYGRRAAVASLTHPLIQAKPKVCVKTLF